MTTSVLLRPVSWEMAAISESRDLGIRVEKCLVAEATRHRNTSCMTERASKYVALRETVSCYLDPGPSDALYDCRMSDKLTITRPSAYFGKVRKLLVNVDGNNVGYVNNAETREFELGAGSHSVSVSMDWCSSPTLDIQVADDERVSLAVDMPGPMASFQVMLAPKSLICLRYVESPTPPQSKSRT